MDSVRREWLAEVGLVFAFNPPPKLQVARSALVSAIASASGTHPCNLKLIANLKSMAPLRCGTFCEKTACEEDQAQQDVDEVVRPAQF